MRRRGAAASPSTTASAAAAAAARRLPVLQRRLPFLALFMLVGLLCLGRGAQAFTSAIAPKAVTMAAAARAPLRPRANLILRMSPATGGAGPRVYEEGQDPKEMFDLYEPPTPEERAGAKVTQLRPSGLRKARAKVHAEGDWHRAVHIWLVDDQGGLLLQRRSEFKDTFPDRWDVSVGGHLDAGEEMGPTAVRELEEELGLTGPLAQKLDHLFTLACTNKGETKRHGAFTCNEFQEIFLLPVGPRHDLSMYKYPPGEVTDIKVMHYRDLEAKLAAGDEEYVPRAPHYRRHLWAHLDERFGKKK